MNQRDFKRNSVMSTDTGQLSRSAGQTEVGLVRSSNEDAILLDERAGLWLVADGMGGHAGGGEASRLASGKIHASVRDGASLRESILAAHHAIRAGQTNSSQFADMGTTVVALHESRGAFQIAWVGDSRAYSFDAHSGRLEQLTRDHNLAGLMIESGELTRAEAARHPRRHMLTHCLGLQGSREPRVDLIEGCWQDGQLILLCSDGLSGELDDLQIADVLASQASLPDKVQMLIRRVKNAGARDNVSVVLIAAPAPGAGPSERRGWRRWLARR